MKELTSRERVHLILNRKLQDVDRIAFLESIWGETIKRWQNEGFIKENEDVIDFFKMDIKQAWTFDLAAKIGFHEVVEEDAETQLIRNGNGALLRVWKNKSGTPEHVDFLVKDRSGWEEHIKPFLTPSRQRINFEGYRKVKKDAAEKQLFFPWGGVSVFEIMHPICGHEYMLMGMALDPDWILDMTNTFTDLIINLWEILFAEEGLPDGIFFYEDMGFKGRPFMSPAMYKELVMPAHKRQIQWVHQRGLKVIMHSCGFVEPLLPGMIEAGIDMLQAMEVKAGMDVLKLNKLYGDKIGFMGNIDIREIASNDKKRIDTELKKKILPLMKSRTPYILSSDHSTPPDVNFETFLYFRDRGLELGKYS
jgi:uroporphyrinogen decarboxylase